MKVIVFDIGGTLMEYKGMPLSWLDHYKGAFRYVSDELSLGLSEKDIDKSYEVMKRYNPRIVPREKDVAPEVIFADASAHWHTPSGFSLSEVIGRFYESMHLTSYIYPETIGFLEWLRENGYIITTMTDIAIGMPDELHQSYFAELMPYFDMYVSSLSCGYRKPNPKGLSDIAARYAVSADDMIMIGDEQKDILTAKRFGCRSVLIDRQGRGADYGQDYTVNDLEMLKEII